MKPNASKLSVVLVDDHAIVRQGIRALLDTLPDVDVLADVGSGREALALLATVRPDVLLLDITLDGESGLDVCAQVAADYPTVKVVMLTMHVNDSYVTRAMTLGAVGYVLKDAAFAELELALRAVLRGDLYLSPRAITPVINRATTTDADPRTLTRRQLEILRLVASGRSTKEIAFELGLSTKTVDAHRAGLMSRLAIRDIPSLVRYAMRIGLVAGEV